MSHSLMEPHTEMYGPGSNIASRSDTIQVNNDNANRYWYTETVSSKNRDRNLYPSPSQYVVPLSRKYERVLEVELLTAQIPLSTYVIECRDQTLGNQGNNSFRFNEGYIIDDGSVYAGMTNDQITVREYSDPMAGPSCCVDQECVAQLPHTLTRVSTTVKTIHHGDCVDIVTCCPHNFSTKYHGEFHLVDSDSAALNGQYRLVKILDKCAIRAKRIRPDTCPSSLTSQSSVEGQQADDGEGGWIFIRRLESPHELARLVQDYLNHHAHPRPHNAYSITFNDTLGRFIFTRAGGGLFFDLLVASDHHSVLSRSMGFSYADYYYGQYSHLTNHQTRLPSDMLQDTIRPDIHSQSVGDSALISVGRGNYNASELAEAVTTEMQRPLIKTGLNDLLVVQVQGHFHDIHVPCGMYTPDLLIDTVADLMSQLTPSRKFSGLYFQDQGVFRLESDDQVPFGLIFSRSTIGALLGFQPIDLTGNWHYTSLDAIFFPVANCRYTDQVYSVVAQCKDQRFRFTKCGAYQSPVIHLEPVRKGPQGAEGTRIHTWSMADGGCAHGFQVGDVITLNDSLHVVVNVCDAFSFDICATLVDHAWTTGESKDGHQGFVVSHWFQPFSLFFPGVEDTLALAMGFPVSVSQCVDYVAPLQWVLQRQRDVYINIKELCNTDNGRICKTSDSGCNSKYQWSVHNSFVRIPLSAAVAEGIEFGLLSNSAYYRKHRFTTNSRDLYEVSVSLVDDCGNLIDFHGRDHSMDLRILIEQ